jgi:hypothetical protein
MCNVFVFAAGELVQIPSASEEIDRNSLLQVLIEFTLVVSATY